MKALRFFFLSLLATFAFAASAQTIEIYKDGRVIDSFSATQVDSVVYAPAAAQPRYYYYAGWDCPTSVEGTEETSLVNLIDNEYPKDLDSAEKNMAGGLVLGTFDSFEYKYTEHPLFDQQCWDEYEATGVSERNYYVVVPKKSDTSYIKIYDRINSDLTISDKIFTKYDELDNHIIYVSSKPSLYINGIIIKK